MTTAKTKRTPHQLLVSTNPRVLAAHVAATCPSPCHFQPPRARHPWGYLTQDQWGECSRSLISTVAVAKATKPADDSGDDNDNNDQGDVRSIGKKDNDGGDDKQGVKEGGMSAAAKAAKPGGDDSKDDDNNKEEDKDNEEVQKGGNKRGDEDDDPSASMGTGSSLSLSDEVVMWVSFNLSYVKKVIIQFVILQIASICITSFLMIIHRIGDATSEEDARWLHLSIYKLYIQICILSPYSLAINHSAEAIVDAVIK